MATTVLDEKVQMEIDHWLQKFPPERKQSAILAALRTVQHHNDGYLTTALMDAIAAYLKLPEIAVYEVASFYSMFATTPVGKHCISVCTNVSCMLRGSDDIVAHLEKRLGITLGESTKDGRFWLKREEECLAACCAAPVMQLDHKYYENLDIDKVDQILDAVEE